MVEFAVSTGLEPPSVHPQRYLWTDAFAVRNFLELFKQTCDEKYKELALELVGQVHHTLGRHRSDASRTGWISGLNENDGELHPTSGGLRIGKPLPERLPGEPLNERLEWDQDGQYYHYLTKWMHALNQTGNVTSDPKFILWAVELAKTAHGSFTYFSSTDRQRRMYWKMSIDLKNPLVSSMGQHDPLDGFITYNELHITALKSFGSSKSLDLTAEIEDMNEICQGLSWTTDDPLGIGGLLFDAFRIAQLMSKGYLDLAGILESVLDSVLVGLDYYSQGSPLDLPPEYRLAFRELGLSIGLRGALKLLSLTKESSDIIDPEDSLQPRLEDLMEYLPLAGKIEEFWIDHENQRSASWTEHKEINMVMLATSLAPDGFLMI
ncbi:MAG: hypothetical protein HY802_00940 [Methanobacterium sp.]|nr:hypothetical protein [Methanobacterium sp.]